ncbi:MAG: transglutaminase domain-containing protein [Chloroflexi bacterium]|nr:transglutaminase domain-containing protein [Chloroflexota bacterium]
MPPGFVRLFLYAERKLRPAEGWLVVAALVVSILIVVQAVEEAAWVRDAPAMYASTVIAFVLGMVMAKRVGRARWAVVSAILVGLIVTTMTAARAWPSMVLLRANVRYLVDLLRFSEEPGVEVVPVHLWVLDHVLVFVRSLVLWGQSIAGGNPLSIGPALTITLLLMLWGVAFWAGWAAIRYHRALAALAPSGIFLAMNVFFSETGLVSLSFFVAGMIVLGMALKDYSLTSRWARDKVDYSPEFRLEFYLMGFFVAATVTAAMLLTPSFRLSAVTKAFWSLFRESYQAVEAQAERVIPELNRMPRSLDLGGPIEQGGLPRSHLIGAAPELERKLVMFVRASDPDASSETQANYRWRGITFSDYLGRGWENPHPIETVRYTPGESWLATSEQGRRSIRQSFDFVGDRPTWLFALGEPIAADRSYTAHYRQPDDIIGLEVRAPDYTVISQIPAVSEAKLRALPAPVSDSLAGYLTLPDTTPDRVKALAREVTAGAETPYDQAKALEAYLRGYPYNLDIPDLPEHVADIADYFLFDLQQGYCDYYATTMVVMARSLGLPARLAIGYAAGFYDNQRNRFAVTEADAHSWPEIYFPTYGWIPFEPTAAQPIYVREPDSGLDSVDTAAAQLDFRAEIDNLRRQAWLYRGAWRWGVALFGLALTMLLIRFVAREWRLRRRAANPWQLAYLRLEAWGNTFGVTPAVWYTPGEYVSLWRAFISRTQPHRAAALAIADSINELGEAIEKRAYAPPLLQPDDAQAKQHWRRLRAELWRLRISSWLRRGQKS